MDDRRSTARTVTAVVFILTAFAVSVLCSWHDLGPDRLSPRAAPGGGDLLVGLLLGTIASSATWLLLRRRSRSAAASSRSTHDPRHPC